jgi:hypothetical protein
MPEDRAFLPLYALAAHFAGDWPLQTDEMAVEKFEDPRTRGSHVLVYSLAFLPVVLAAGWDRRGSVAFLVTLAGSHFVIDSRRWKENYDGFPTRALWFDQAFHLICLALAAALGEVIDDA